MARFFIFLDQHAFGVSYSRWWQQRLTRWRRRSRTLRWGLKSFCEAKLLSKWTFRLCVKRFYWIRVEFKVARQNIRVLQWHHMTPLRLRGRRRSKKRKLLGYRRTCVCSNIRCRSRCTRWKRLLNLRRRKTKGNFTSRGPNWVLALDGHDKLLGYQDSTLPYRRLRMHWHLQPKNASGQGLGLLVQSKNDSEEA